MSERDLQSAIGEWTRILGSDHVLTTSDELAPYMQNVSGLVRSIPAVLQPATAEEVQELVRIANRFNQCIHPISCGKNWGFGSRLPVRDNTVIVELSRMNRIRSVNVEHHYAVVEPGVTQRQLYEHILLNKLPLMFNVTGASVETSVLGNALERGIGYFSSRAESLSGMEVILGNGDMLRTGFGHYEQSLTTHLYRHGIGPSVDGLFMQSNFGVVTAAGIDLMPAPKAKAAMIAKIERADQLLRFMDRLVELRRREVFRTVTHVGNRERTLIALAPLVYRHMGKDRFSDSAARRRATEQLIARAGFGPWSAVSGIMGTARQVRNACTEIKKSLGTVAKVSIMTDSLVDLAKRVSAPLQWIPWVRNQRAILSGVEPLYRLSQGIPTSAAMASVYWPLGEPPEEDDEDPDQSSCGMLFCTPFLPAEGRIVKEAMNYTYHVFERYGFTPYVTLNLIDAKCIECVINNAFDRRDEKKVEAAHACNEELTGGFARQGYMPYRVGVQSMPLVVDEHDPYWQTIHKLKRALDPKGIISPGRYGLD